eukprot:3351985-Amphidinium_carterae.1
MLSEEWCSGAGCCTIAVAALMETSYCARDIGTSTVKLACERYNLLALPDAWRFCRRPLGCFSAVVSQSDMLERPQLSGRPYLKLPCFS